MKNHQGELVIFTRHIIAWSVSDMSKRNTDNTLTYAVIQRTLNLT